MSKRNSRRVELVITPKTAFFTQVLNILDETLSGEDLIEGLENGKYSTTLSYFHDRPSYVIDMETDVAVAEILTQTAEFEYTLEDEF
jgi:hypothetical protein